MQNTHREVTQMMKTAMQNSKVRNTLLLIYVLAVLVFSASVRASEITIDPVLNRSSIATQMKTLNGEVVLSAEGQAFLVVSDEVFYELRTQSQDLTAFNGLRVQVQGYEIVHKVGPVQTTFSLVPLTDEDDSTLAAPVLVVLQIRELVN